MLARGQEAVDAGCTELHIVGGVHPRKPFGWYVGIIRRLHAAYPRLHLKAFTAVEIDWFSQIARRPVPAVLEELMAAGLGSLPGGGAEIFDPAVRAANLPGQGRRRRPGWTSIARPTSWACAPTPPCSTATWRSAGHRIDHLMQLRAAAGRDRRLPGLHPLGLSSPKHAAGPLAQGLRAGSISAPWP